MNWRQIKSFFRSRRHSGADPADFGENAQFRALADSTPDSIIITDEHGTILYWNQGSQTVFGYTPGEIIGRSIDVLLRPKESQVKDDAFAMPAAVGEAPVFASVQRSVAVRRDGTVFPLELTLSQWDQGGRHYFCSIIRDITERLRIEEQFRAIFTASTDAIIITDSAGTILTCNPATATVFGYDPAELIGSSVKQMIPAEARAAAEELFDKEDLSPPGTMFETMTRRKDGSEVYISSAMSCWEISGRRFYSSINRDVTQARRMEQQLQQSRKMEAIGTLAGGIAHDFNNVLAGIMGYAELAQDDLTHGVPDEEHLSRILQLGERARDLVRQILTFSRKTVEESGPVLLQPVVGECLDMLRAIVPKTVEVRPRLQHDSGPVIANAVQMQQVVMNLCANAVDAMQAVGGVLEVVLEETDIAEKTVSHDFTVAPGRYVCLRVRDSGNGISPENLKRIFEPFFTTREKGRGTGMGLAVVYGIVRSHGGAITVQSTPGQGTVFSVLLPRAEGVTSDALPQQADAGAPPAGTESILFVDDEQAIVEIAQRMFAHMGYTVTAVRSAPQALALFRDDPDGYDLVITDYSMPRVTGFELAQEVRRIRPDIPVLLCTGYAEPVSVQQAQESGVREIIAKPFRRDEIARVVRQALDRTGL